MHEVIATITNKELSEILEIFSRIDTDPKAADELVTKKKELASKYGYDWEYASINNIGQVRILEKGCH
jgi:hypothetical protein